MSSLFRAPMLDEMHILYPNAYWVKAYHERVWLLREEPGAVSAGSVSLYEKDMEEEMRVQELRFLAGVQS